jgi:hypothetical protein
MMKAKRINKTSAFARRFFWEKTLKALLNLSRFIDGMTDGIGRLVYWLVLVAALISCGNAVVHYVLNTSFNM